MNAFEILMSNMLVFEIYFSLEILSLLNNQYDDLLLIKYGRF
jgi:hypothetical protein